MKCEYCGKVFSDSVWEIHKAWCKDQPKANKEEAIEEPKEEVKEPARGRPRKG